MPHIVCVTCPECQNEARFEFARCVRIELKKDVPAFKNNKYLSYSLEVDSCGHKYHCALFYPGLVAQKFTAIKGLPAPYDNTMWKLSQYLNRYGSLRERGALICKCGVRRKHILNWPKDAFYKIEYHSEELWAFNREYLITLTSYIQSTNRNSGKPEWRHSIMHNFLIKIPKQFLTAKAREPIMKKLNKLRNNS